MDQSPSPSARDWDRLAGAVIAVGSLFLVLVWALGAWLVSTEASAVVAVAQGLAALAGIVALGRLSMAGRAVWRERAGTEVFARPMMAALGLAALWWVLVSLMTL